MTVDPNKTLVSVKLPSTTTPGNPPIQAYLMALTLEEPGGAFVTPDLGASPFPDDLTAPTSTHTLDPAQPQGQNGWYRTPSRSRSRRPTSRAARGSTRSSTASTAGRSSPTRRR